MRIIRLIENLTGGSGRLCALCVHGGGAPSGAYLQIRSLTDYYQKKKFAKKLAGVQ
jgi:hypothetical protein